MYDCVLIVYTSARAIRRFQNLHGAHCTKEVYTHPHGHVNADAHAALAYTSTDVSAHSFASCFKNTSNHTCLYTCRCQCSCTYLQLCHHMSVRFHEPIRAHGVLQPVPPAAWAKAVPPVCRHECEDMFTDRVQTCELADTFLNMCIAMCTSMGRPIGGIHRHAYGELHWDVQVSASECACACASRAVYSTELLAPEFRHTQMYACKDVHRVCGPRLLEKKPQLLLRLMLAHRHGL